MVWGYIAGMATESDLIELLKKRQGKSSLRAFADSLDLSAAYLSDVYRGKRAVGPSLCKALGFERTKTTTVRVNFTRRAA
jgi:hypothetical protein